MVKKSSKLYNFGQINCYYSNKKFTKIAMELFAQSCGGSTFNRNSIKRPHPGISVCFGINCNILPICIKENIPFIFFDKSCLFGLKNRDKRIRVSVNGISNHVPIDRPGDRLKGLSISIKKWKKSGDHVLICPPTLAGRSKYNEYRNDSFDILNIGEAWLDDTIQKIRSVSDRKIIVRPKININHHIEDQRVFPEKYLECISKYDKIEKSIGKLLCDDFKDCWATVAPSSGASILGLIEGVPSFCEQNTLADACSANDYSHIERPLYCDRMPLLKHLSYLDFNFDELKDGFAWRTIRDMLHEVLGE